MQIACVIYKTPVKDSAQTTQRQNDLQAKGQFTVEYYIPYREYAY